MRRASISVLAALALLVSAVAIGETTGGAATAPPVKKIAIPGPAGCAGTYFCYKPGNVTVKKGTKVVWTNTSGMVHTVTRCTKPKCQGLNGGTGKQTGFGSPSIANKKSYAFTFKSAGTYRYFCKFHGYPTMHGLVTVK
jgi:plastocyanin